MKMEYTKNLLAKGEERKRLTEQLAALVDRVANQISDIAPVGTEVTAGGATYKVVRLRSNLGGQNLLAVVDNDGFGEVARIFGKGVGEPDEVCYLHGDFGCPYRSATRGEYLRFANNLPAIIAAFEAEEERVIGALRRGFEVLRAVAEAEREAK